MKFSILSWNIQGKRALTRTSFKKVIPALEELLPDIVCLQEADEAQKKLHHLNSFESFYRVMPEREVDKNVILSKFPILEQGEIDFSSFAKRPLQRTLWMTVRIGEKNLRVYNCHFGPVVRIQPHVRARQLRTVVEHAENYNGPIIICGDLNTTTPREGLQRKVIQMFQLMPKGQLHIEGEYFTDDERYIFARIAEQSGFREATDISESTWRVAPLPWGPFNMKLDWFLVRGVETPNVVLRPYISDHKAIHAECLLR